MTDDAPTEEREAEEPVEAPADEIPLKAAAAVRAFVKSSLPPGYESPEHLTDRIVHAANPLSEWLRGNTTIHFVGGGSATVELSQKRALDLKAKDADEEPDDRITWDAPGWFTVHRERVAMIQFESHPAWGTEFTPEEDKTLKAKKYVGGHLGRLVELYTDKPEPSFSAMVVHGLLRGIAVDPKMDDETFAWLAHEYEGHEGARRFVQVKTKADRGERAVLRPPTKSDLEFVEPPREESDVSSETPSEEAAAPKPGRRAKPKRPEDDAKQ